MTTQRVAAVDDEGRFYGDVAAQLSGTYVVFRNHDGTPVAAPRVVAITLTADGTDIDNIAVYDSIDEVGS